MNNRYKVTLTGSEIETIRMGMHYLRGNYEDDRFDGEEERERRNLLKKIDRLYTKIDDLESSKNTL